MLLIVFLNFLANTSRIVVKIDTVVGAYPVSMKNGKLSLFLPHTCVIYSKVKKGVCSSYNKANPAVLKVWGSVSLRTPLF